jgi:hypothetical protein
MRKALRWGFAALLIVHGLIHLLGAAEGLHWADAEDLDGLTETEGIVWLITAALVLTAAVVAARRVRGWWLVLAAAALLSQAVVIGSWADAKAATVVNLIMLVAAVYGYASDGPAGLRAEYQRRVRQELTGMQPSSSKIDEADLARLPDLVATYIRRSGAVGRPRVMSFQATVHGRIRGGPNKPWMSFAGRQVNTFGPNPSRLFFMDATMFGLPVDVLHVFTGGAAAMRGRLCSLIRILDAAGPDMTRAETVTLFNDLCIMAPAALPDAPVTWTPVDSNAIRGTFSLGRHEVSATLLFNEAGDLVDFVSEDRLRASPDGKAFTRLGWSTPLGDYAELHGRRLATVGRAMWHAPEPEGRFTYLEFHIDDIEYDAVTPVTRSGRRGSIGSSQQAPR